jgi:hypothetical protein
VILSLRVAVIVARAATMDRPLFNVMEFPSLMTGP